ncbi:MAG: xanthine phosphoribosyltransferase [Clostridia bacterium]|nr:xanthine phosphoribosyltransferase [Clostridia bacterium]
MKALQERILKDGKVLPGHVLKVGSFLNHQIDTPFMMEMGKEIARIFAEDKPTKILTIEASGIALGIAAAAAMGLPMVFAKKKKSINVEDDLYSTIVHSYTHNIDYRVVVSKENLTAEDRILIVDDFLANGCAIRGLMDLVAQAGGTVVGCTTAIEKGFQGGGDKLRQEGIKVESLAVIDEMTDDSLVFRN